MILIRTLELYEKYYATYQVTDKKADINKVMNEKCKNTTNDK